MEDNGIAGAPNTMTQLRHRAFSLDLMPETGGSVRAFRLEDRDVLRPHADGVSPDPLQSGGFPLLPFSGRIDQARFNWQGRDVQLRRNFPPEAHAIHGESWLAPWHVEELSDSSCTLVFENDASDWPWRYRGRQVFTLGDHGLDLSLELVNFSDTPMPAGLGWHPYFPRGDAMIEAPVTSVWRKRADHIPLSLAPLSPATDLNASRAVAQLELDDIFVAPARQSVMTWASRRLRVTMTATPVLSTLVVFVPKGRDFFCVEPVSHVPDAVNMVASRAVTGLVSLEPGATLSANIRLAVEAL